MTDWSARARDHLAAMDGDPGALARLRDVAHGTTPTGADDYTCPTCGWSTRHREHVAHVCNGGQHVIVAGAYGEARHAAADLARTGINPRDVVLVVDASNVRYLRGMTTHPANVHWLPSAWDLPGAVLDDVMDHLDVVTGGRFFPPDPPGMPTTPSSRWDGAV